MFSLHIFFVSWVDSSTYEDNNRSDKCNDRKKLRSYRKVRPYAFEARHRPHDDDDDDTEDEADEG